MGIGRVILFEPAHAAMRPIGMPKAIRVILIACVTLAAAPALAQSPKTGNTAVPPSPSGSAVAVLPAALARNPAGERTLVAGQDVFGGDTISTSEQGTAQILFKDDTRLVVGPDSSVVIDKFVYDPGGSPAGATLNFARGAFRFITGKGRHESYVLQTPTASIGVRGTEFDVAVGSQGTAVIVFRGAVEVCHRSTGECALLQRSCSAALATTGGQLTVPGRFSSREGLIDAAFPLVKDQTPLREDFRVFTGGCGLGGGTKSKGGSGPGGGGGGRGGRGGNGGQN